MAGEQRGIPPPEDTWLRPWGAVSLRASPSPATCQPPAVLATAAPAGTAPTASSRPVTAGRHLPHLPSRRLPRRCAARRVLPAALPAGLPPMTARPGSRRRRRPRSAVGRRGPAARTPHLTSPHRPAGPGARSAARSAGSRWLRAA